MLYSRNKEHFVTFSPEAQTLYGGGGRVQNGQSLPQGMTVIYITERGLIHPWDLASNTDKPT